MSSTKEKIKKAAQTLFATNGFVGTSMKDIADKVGIRKASLYSHFSSKEEILFEVYKEVSSDYLALSKRLMEESKEMEIQDRLEHLFKGYIVHYYHHKEYQAFWSQIQLHLVCPPEIKEAIFKDITEKEQFFQKGMEEIFQEAMEQKVIREDKPSRLVMSFRAMRDGLLSWMLVVPEIKEEHISSFWKDYWFGLENREGQGKI